MRREWTKEQLEDVRLIVAKAPSHAEGYRRAAAKYGSTFEAVRGLQIVRQYIAQERAVRRDSAAIPEPPGPPADVLDAYTARRSERAERSHIRALERDLHDARQALDVHSALTAAPLRPVQRFELRSGLREAMAVGMLSDVHCEEIVRPGETPYPNEYNPQIAERSIARFFLGFKWLLEMHRPKFKIRSAALWLGGDLMTGHIHPENVENTVTSPIETLLWLRDRLVAGITSLLEDPELVELRIPCSYGNHGRNTPKPYRALGAVHSYEWLLYQILAAQFAHEPRVQFLADRSAHQYLQAYDKTLHFHHGDETNYGGGVGGIMIPLNKAVAQWDIARRADLHHFGHWHQYIDAGRVTVNGSVIGFNGYAMSVKAAPEPPQQAFYLLDSKRGKTCKSPIWVRESPAGGKAA